MHGRERLLDLIQLDALADELLQRQATLLVELDERRKIALGQASPYHDDFNAPPWEKKSMSGISNVNSEVGTPTNTTVPARSRAYKACFHVSGRPTASTTTSAPNPPVSSCTASTGLACEASIVWVAPNSVAHCSFFGSRSMAMIGDAPANRALAIAESPTPRTRSPRPNPHARHCRVHPGAEAGHHTAAKQADHRGVGVRIDPGALALVYQGLIGERVPSAEVSSVPSASVIGRLALKVSKQYQGPPAAASPAATADHPPVQHDEVTDLHM